jgi:hypothetical protein
MVNQDILTALKNSIERGESLENSVKILINSGYNPAEVQEASKFVGVGVISMQQPKPEEHFAMPGMKKIFKSKNPQQIQIPNSVNKLEQNQIQEIQQIKQGIQSDSSVYLQPIQPQQTTQQSSPTYSSSYQALPSESLSSQIKKISPPRTYLKEIILLIILIALVGVLIGVLWFRPQIISFFSKL